MPLKSGRLTRPERAVAKAMAETGNVAFAAFSADVGKGAVGKAVQRPAVQAEMARLQTERLFNEALPAAVGFLVQILGDSKAPSGARVQAAKVVIDRTLGNSEAGRPKEPHEYSGEDLAKAIAELEREAASRAVDVTPEPAEPASVFD